MTLNYNGLPIPETTTYMGGLGGGGSPQQLGNQFAYDNMANENRNKERMLQEFKAMHGGEGAGMMSGGVIGVPAVPKPGGKPAGNGLEGLLSAIFSGGGGDDALPGLGGVQAGGGASIGDMSIQGGDNQKAYGSLLGAMSQNKATEAGLQGSVFQNLMKYFGDIGTAGIGAGAQTGVAKTMADKDRYVAELQLQGVDKTTAEMLAQEKVRQEGGLAIQNSQNQPALQEIERKKSQIPIFQQLASAFMPHVNGDGQADVTKKMGPNRQGPDLASMLATLGG